MAVDTFADSDLDQAIDTTGTTADDLNSGGFVDKECKAHLLVTDVKKETKPGKVPCLVLTMQVMAASEPTQKGKFLTHRINLLKGNWSEGNGKKTLIDTEPLTENGKKMLLRVALGLELIQSEDIGRSNLVIPWSQTPGRQCMSHLRHGDEYEDSKTGEKKKGSVGIQFGEVFTLNDERCKDWPRDTEAANPANLDDF